MKTVPLFQVSKINPRFINTENLSSDAKVSFVAMASVSEKTKSIVNEEERSLREVVKGFTYFENDDVLLAKITPCFENGKVALARINNSVGFGSTEFHVIRADNNNLDSKYLFHFLRRDNILFEGERRMTGSAGQKRVPKGFIENLQIPLPPLSEQKRIAEVLDKADALREKRRRALQKLDTLLQSVFLEMFGDPVRNPKGWETKNLCEIATFVGGGTPSREVPEYYTGDICWATSKDMKGIFLSGTQEHITEEAVEKSATKLVPIGTILVVVKSKILMRYLPVLITKVPTCFGQDLKGIVLEDKSLISYIAQHLIIGQRTLLQKARGVNTEGLTLEHLRNYKIAMPPKEIIQRFSKIEQTIRGVILKAENHLMESENLFQSLQQRAFKGELFGDESSVMS